MKKKPVALLLAALSGIAFTSCDNKPVAQGGDKIKQETVIKNSGPASAESVDQSGRVSAESVENTLTSNEDIDKNLKQPTNNDKKLTATGYVSPINAAHAISFQLNVPQTTPDGKPAAPKTLILATTLTNVNVNVQKGHLTLSSTKGGGSLEFNMQDVHDLQGLNEEFKMKPLDTNIQFPSIEGFPVTTTPMNVTGPNGRSDLYLPTASGAQQVADVIGKTANSDNICIATPAATKLPKAPGALERQKLEATKQQQQGQ